MWIKKIFRRLKNLLFHEKDYKDVRILGYVDRKDLLTLYDN